MCEEKIRRGKEIQLRGQTAKYLNHKNPQEPSIILRIFGNLKTEGFYVPEDLSATRCSTLRHTKLDDPCVQAFADTFSFHSLFFEPDDGEVANITDLSKTNTEQTVIFRRGAL